jgi:23S rRNA (guanine2445-N2)-methyltransferase / 23S rRNA (guanine2069-N7)-methyltransferase
VATVSLDLSGQSLHRRGYREEGAMAPLKENLAAAILQHANWSTLAVVGCAFLDPMCGSGTLPIEAAMIAADIAPGIKRKKFGFERWKDHDGDLWTRLLQEASSRIIRDRARLPVIAGFDYDSRAISVARENVKRADVGWVKIEKKELDQTDPVGPGTAPVKGIIVVNPPYGERLGEEEELKPLYKRIGDTFKRRFKGWEGYIFTGNPELAKCIGLKPSKRIVLYNGAIECRLLKFNLY